MHSLAYSLTNQARKEKRMIERTKFQAGGEGMCVREFV